MITSAELSELLKLPLDRKIGIAQARLAEWYNAWGGGGKCIFRSPAARIAQCFSI